MFTNHNFHNTLIEVNSVLPPFSYNPILNQYPLYLRYFIVSYLNPYKLIRISFS